MSTKAEDSHTFQSISASHLNYLRLCSLLPWQGKGFSHPFSLLFQLWNHLAIFGFNAMWHGYGIRMLQRGDVEIDLICEEITVLDITARYFLLLIKREKLGRHIETCRKLWSYLKAGEDMFVSQFERKGYYLRNFVMINSVMVTTAFIITATFVRLPPLEANGTERRMLPARFFMDVQEDPAYSIVFASQSILLLSVDVMIGSTQTVSLYPIMMACGYLRSVRNRLLSLEGSDNGTDAKGEATFKFVVDCAHFHQQIIIFCEDIERMTRMLFFFACFCPIYNVSIAGIVILNSNEDKIKFVLLLVYNFFLFFLCQWAPEHLTVESRAIAEAAYFASLQPLASSYREKINWILYFMVVRAQKPIQLTAGGFAPLSIQTFGAMTKSAFSFFMVLRNFRT
ncbi:odorant receptor 219 [Nasonia vitripennis]|uniref:Odorant receptor n=1 Tax=Nasonia vitripennis TaxID=7425 RepID=A0A7M6UGX7_NASVI|nr:odorant receptor 219 [Nasonia vitripennis]